ncbi:hypothetical protein V7S43_003704 [Phytophthora oleae]|uniref:Uncharacterized protein n=1 Tax=Phytophthora oleae TaxID=2107226 RepID=A0ABD3G1F1_9STRA
MERLAAWANGTKWSVASILDEVLPEQRNLCEARSLLTPSLPKLSSVDGKRRKTRDIPDDKCRKHNQSVGRLRAEPSRSSSRVDVSTKQQLSALTSTTRCRLQGHALTLWEDKFRLKCLASEDILFLLVHPNVASTLESASFLRELDLSYDQVMKLETAIAMLRRQDEWVYSHSSKVSTSSLYIKLARNAWIHGRVLPASRTVLPQVIVTTRTPSRTSNRAKPQRPPTDSRRPAPTVVGCPLKVREWVRDNCMEEIYRSATMRKQFAGEKLSIIMSRYCERAKHRRFAHWHQQTKWLQSLQQIQTFCRLKCALWILQRSRKRLECTIFRLWGRWMSGVVCQRESEAIAATVAIQSWIRGVKGKQAAAVHHLHQAATLIQARWRGCQARRLSKRKKRFIAYNEAAHRVQGFYHSYIFRVRCAVWMKQQRAARVVTRTFVRYVERKRDFLAWSHHLARYHAAISIQLWIRRTRRRVAKAKAKSDRQANARRVLFKFFRYARFLRCFGLRVESTVKTKTAAAVLLQNAYRAKRARTQFYELKVHLEGQRRQEILTLMWNNAYATTIQTWWRKRKHLARRRLLSSSVQVADSAP